MLRLLVRTVSINDLYLLAAARQVDLTGQRRLVATTAQQSRSSKMQLREFHMRPAHGVIICSIRPRGFFRHAGYERTSYRFHKAIAG